MAGITVLMSDTFSLDSDSVLGSTFMLAAAISWAAGTVMIKRLNWGIPVISLTAWQLIIGSVPMVIGAVVLGTPDVTNVSAAAWGSVAYNVFLGTSLGMLGFLKALSIFPATITSIGTLMVPVVGVISANLVLGEPLGWRELVSLALVCIALALILPRIGARRG